MGVALGVIPVVELLTSELVANAVTHGGPSDVRLRVGFVSGAFEVEVRDRGERLPVTRATGPEVPGGHGMRLVDMLAASWGVRTHRAGGKTVWFTIAACGNAA